MVDDDMPELDRSVLLLERGRPVQRLSVMRNLARLAADHGARAKSATTAVTFLRMGQRPGPALSFAPRLRADNLSLSASPFLVVCLALSWAGSIRWRGLRAYFRAAR